jgi:hypothetical protein
MGILDKIKRYLVLRYKTIMFVNAKVYEATILE